MRRAVLAVLLSAAPLLAAPAYASTDMVELAALRELLTRAAGSSGHGDIRIPLGSGSAAARSSAATAARSSRELASIARDEGPARLLVGARRHDQLDGVAAALRRLGAREPHRFTTIGALAATVPSAAVAAATLHGDPRVAYVERDRTLRAAQDPFDRTDLPPPAGSGIKFTWAYDAVRAGDALAAVGGGSRRTVAVIDTGIDVNHAEFAGQIARTFDTVAGGPGVRDVAGHGTFVAGMIAARDGNGFGGKGVAGTTKLVVVRASRDEEGSFSLSDLIRGIELSIRSGADVINMSLAGRGFSLTQARALQAVFFADVLPVAASGNRGEAGNPLEFPAAAIGGRRGAAGIGLSVAATRPDGSHASFSNHNSFVSLAAPGASAGSCELGVFSTLPANTTSGWDNQPSCSRTFADAGGRYAYAEGTSFAAPVVSGLAALAWEAERRLASEQVADVLVRSAGGSGWNEFTGAGVADGLGAVSLARVYDVLAPRARGRASRRGNRVRASVRRTRDRTRSGDELAGAVTYVLFVSRDGGRSFSAVRSRRRPFSASVRLRGRRANVLMAGACDGNGNCAFKRLGRFRRR